jgi:putrescine transport system permease protein
MASTDVVHRARRLPGTGVIEGMLHSLGIRGRTLVIAIPFLWLVLFFVVPFLIVLWVSTSFIVIAKPPYTHISEAGTFTLNIGDSFGRLVTDTLYIKAYFNSLVVAAVSTFLCLVIAYPVAYGMARCGRSTRNILLMLVILPFWTSFLIRVYAWIGLLKNNGLINSTLLAIDGFLTTHFGIDLMDGPINMMNTNFAVYLGIVYSYLPFMILPLYANLEKMDMSLLEAATDLGCRPIKAFFVITVPLSFPGIVAGSMLVFIPAVGEYVIPELLGGPSSLMIGRVLWNEFFSNRDWPTASAVAVAILLALVVPLMIYQKFQDKELEKQS